MPDLFTNDPVPVGEKILVLERELQMRRKVYPNKVATGKMSQTMADRQIAVMEAILADYQELPPRGQHD